MVFLTETRSSIALADCNSDSSQDTRTYNCIRKKTFFCILAPEMPRVNSAAGLKPSTHHVCYETFVLQDNDCIENMLRTRHVKETFVIWGPHSSVLLSPTVERVSARRERLSKLNALAFSLFKVFPIIRIILKRYFKPSLL